MLTSSLGTESPSAFARSQALRQGPSEHTLLAASMDAALARLQTPHPLVSHVLAGTRCLAKCPSAHTRRALLSSSDRLAAGSAQLRGSSAEVEDAAAQSELAGCVPAAETAHCEFEAWTGCEDEMHVLDTPEWRIGVNKTSGAAQFLSLLQP